MGCKYGVILAGHTTPLKPGYPDSSLRRCPINVPNAGAFLHDSNMNRRSFLKATLTATSLAQLSSNLTAADSSQPASSRIRIGFLGASHSHAFEKVRLTKDSPNFELVGVCEESEGVRRRLQNLGVQFISQEELFAKAQAVAVGSDVQDHARHAKSALLAGKHVHLEKPPADRLDVFQELVRLAEEKKLLLQMGYMWRFNPGINAALEAARQGWLGAVYLVRATINTSIAANQRREWAQFRGGTMFDLGSHVIDPMVRLLGRPEKVTSFLKKHGPFEDDLADNTVAVFEFPHALGIVTSTTLQPNAFSHRFFEVLGTKGTARVKPIEQPVLEVDLAEAAGPYPAKTQTINFPPYKRYAPEFAEFAEAIRQQRPLAVTPREDLLVQETLLRACRMD